LAEAFQALLTERGFERISVADIAARAGTSIGGFYARYGSKDALLLPAAAGLLADAEAALLAALADRRTAGKPLGFVVQSYTRVMTIKFTEHRRVLGEVFLNARGPARDAIVARVQQFNQTVHGRFRALARARLGEISHPDPELAIEFGLFQASAAAREAILKGVYNTGSRLPPVERLTREIARGWTRYLGCPDPTDRPSGNRAERAAPARRKVRAKKGQR
jgi:AcrR family transcriptional regulator